MLQVLLLEMRCCVSANRLTGYGCTTVNMMDSLQLLKKEEEKNITLQLEKRQQHGSAAGTPSALQNRNESLPAIIINKWMELNAVQMRVHLHLWNK